MGINESKKHKNQTVQATLTYTLEQQLDAWCSTHQFVWTPSTPTETTTNMKQKSEVKIGEKNE